MVGFGDVNWGEMEEGSVKCGENVNESASGGRPPNPLAGSFRQTPCKPTLVRHSFVSTPYISLQYFTLEFGGFVVYVSNFTINCGCGVLQ